MTSATLTPGTDSDLIPWLAEQGYTNLRTLDDGTVVGTIELMFTRALCIGLNRWSWERRYCYESRLLATVAAHAILTGDDEPVPGWVAKR